MAATHDGWRGEAERLRVDKLAVQDRVASLEIALASTSRSEMVLALEKAALAREAEYRESQLQQLRTALDDTGEALAGLLDERTALRQEIDRREQGAAELREQLRTALSSLQSWESYGREVETMLALYRGQRAWRIMLAVRKAYVLLTRQGLSGWLRFPPWLLRLALGKGAIDEQELAFPAPPR